MRQFDVFRDRGDALFVVLQSDLLEPLETVVVAPLLRAADATAMRKLTPRATVDDTIYLVMVHAITAIRAAPLRRQERIASLADDRDAIMDAVNMLYWGI